MSRHYSAEDIASIKALKVGEKFYLMHTKLASHLEGQDTYYERISAAQSKEELKKGLENVKQDWFKYSKQLTATIYGTSCLGCGKKLVETVRVTSSDGMMGVENDHWVCEDSDGCGLTRTCDFMGYGNVQ